MRRRVLKSKAKKDREAAEARNRHYSEDQVDGEEKKLSEAKLQNENLFFFTDQEYFESSRYEYIAPKEPTKGFVFGLFVPPSSDYPQAKDITPAETFSSFSNQQTTLSEIERMYTKKNYRELKNLGSRILDVRPFHNDERTGYQVIYNEGDPCLVEPGKKYQSHVKYQCDPEYKESPNDFPQMVVPDHYQSTETQCNFDFVWHSRFACPPCT